MFIPFSLFLLTSWFYKIELDIKSTFLRVINVLDIKYNKRNSLVKKVTDFLFILLSFICYLLCSSSEYQKIEICTLLQLGWRKHTSTDTPFAIIVRFERWLWIRCHRWTRSTAQNQKMVTSFLLNVLSINI